MRAVSAVEITYILQIAIRIEIIHRNTILWKTDHLYEDRASTFMIMNIFRFRHYQILLALNIYRQHEKHVKEIGHKSSGSQQLVYWP